MQEKMVSRVAGSDIVALHADIDFNTRNAVNNCTQIFGTSTHARNKHSQNWERNMSVAPSGYASNLMRMKLRDSSNRFCCNCKTDNVQVACAGDAHGCAGAM